LPANLYESIKAVNQKEQSTLFMVLLAAFNALLYAYSGKNDIVVATPIAGRNRVEIENLIGLFVNMLLLRVRITGDMTLNELVKSVKEVVLGAHANQDLPFDKLMSELQFGQDQGRVPLTRVAFDLHNEPVVKINLPCISLNVSSVETGVARVDLLVVVRPAASQLGGYFEYNSDIFSSDTVSAMIADFELILRAIAAEPRQSVDNLASLCQGAHLRSGQRSLADNLAQRKAQDLANEAPFDFSL
jgi:non-ribosomal peptide synthetase component F